MELKQPALLKNKGYINGDWYQTDQQFTVRDPATLKAITQVPDMSLTDIELAIDAADEALSVVVKSYWPRVYS